MVYNDKRQVPPKDELRTEVRDHLSFFINIICALTQSWHFLNRNLVRLGVGLFINNQAKLRDHLDCDYKQSKHLDSLCLNINKRRCQDLPNCIQ